MSYADIGCQYSPSCLNCPLKECVYVNCRGGQRLETEMRYREITRLFTGTDKSTKELAAELGISRETVQRALRARRDAVV